MNNNPPRPQSIAAEGLESYLNRTHKRHHEYTYEDYMKFRELGLGPYVRAKLMNVSAYTMYRWDSVYAEENSNA